MVAGPGGGAVLDGVLERVTFANPETGYTIARIAPERGGAELITAVGPLLGAQIGEFLRLRGRWSSHPRYGRQFEVHSYATVLPATAAGIQKYLGSGLIKGIGPVMAERMVAHFGVDIMHVIDDEPGRLIEVDGLGPKRTAMIAAAWAEQKAIKEVMIFLQGVGVSTSLAVRIYKKYGDASVSVVRNEPYRLAADVWGIGFKTADTIATSVGIAPDSPERIKAGLAYTLSEAADDGHCYLPAPNLITDAAKILDVPADLITPCLDELAAADGVVREEVPAAARPAQAQAAPQVPAVYLPPFYQAERSLAHALLRLHAARADRLAGFAAVDWDTALGLAARPDRLRTRPRTSRRGPARPDRQGRGPDRRPRLRQVVHRPVGGRAGPGQGRQDRAGRPDRPGRQAAGRTGRPRRRHHPPAAGPAPRRRPVLRRRQTPGRGPGGGGRDLDGGRDPGQQAGQGGPAGSAPAAGRRRGPAALGRRRGGAPGPAGRRVAAGGAADQDLPAGAAVRHRGQRAPDQRRASARS